MLISAEQYSYFMLVELIFATVSIGSICFLINLVRGKKCFFFKKCKRIGREIIVKIGLLPISASWFWYFGQCNWIFDMRFKSIHILLFRQNHNWFLCKYGGSLVWDQLPTAHNRNTKVLYFNDCNNHFTIMDLNLAFWTWKHFKW